MTQPSRGESEPKGSTSPAEARRGGPILFVRSRRDGARLISSTLVVAVIGLVAWDNGFGRLVGLGAAALSLFWWLQYRKLPQ